MKNNYQHTLTFLAYYTSIYISSLLTSAVHRPPPIPNISSDEMKECLMCPVFWVSHQSTLAYNAKA